MPIFTRTRNLLESRERRVPVISAPFDFHHAQHSSPDGETTQPILAQIGFQHVQHASVGAEIAEPISAQIGSRQPASLGAERNRYISPPLSFQHVKQASIIAEVAKPILAQIGFQQPPSVGPKINQPISPPSGFQHVQHGNLGGEVGSISQVINTQAPVIPPSRRDLNGFVSNPPMTAPPVAKAPIQFNNTMKNLMNRKTHIHRGTNANMTVSSPTNSRSAFSTPELRDSDIPQNIAQLRPVRSIQADSRTSGRRSWFTVTTGIIEGRRTIIRKVLDTLGCTKVDQFNIYEYEPVKPPARTEREFSPGPRRLSSLSLGRTRVAPMNVVQTRAR